MRTRLLLMIVALVLGWPQYSAQAENRPAKISLGAEPKAEEPAVTHVTTETFVDAFTQTLNLRLEPILKEYAGAVSGLKESFQHDALLQEALACQRELKRVNGSPGLTRDDLVAKPQALRDLQLSYVKKVDDRSRLAAAEYVAKLKHTVKTLTIKGELDDAEACNHAVQQIAAQYLLGDNADAPEPVQKHIVPERPTPVRVGHPAVVTEARVVPESGTERTLQLSANWMTPFRTDTCISELGNLLSDHAQPALDLKGNESIKICNEITYLMPQPKAEEILPKHMSSPASLLCRAFPKDSFFYSSYDGTYAGPRNDPENVVRMEGFNVVRTDNGAARTGQFTKLLLVTDRAKQVVAIELVDETPKGESRGWWSDRNDGFKMYDFIQMSSKAMATALIDELTT